MPISIELDVTDGSMIDRLGSFPQRAIRAGRASGLPTDTSTYQPEQVLKAVQDAAVVAAGGDGATFPGIPTLYLNRVQVFGIAASSGHASVKLIYESFQGTLSSTIIEISGGLGTYTTNMMPGTKEPFAIGFAQDTDDESGNHYETIPEDYQSITMPRPTRRVSITQLVPGVLSEDAAFAFSENIGLVSKLAWRGLPPGSWIISNASATISRYGGFYQKRIELLSNGTDKWSFYGILRSSKTGKAAGSAQIISDARQSLVDLPYLPYSRRVATWQGPKLGTDPNISTFKQKGVIRVDPYGWVDVYALIGF